MHTLAPFGPSFRRFVLALGRAVVPPTTWMPGYDERSLERLEAYIAMLGYEQARGVLAAIVALRARIGGFWLGDGDAARDRIAAALDALDRGSAADRGLLATAIMPIKVMHFRGEEIYRAMHVPVPRSPTRDEGPPARGLVDAEGLRELGEVELDAIVIGSGAGGAAAAAALARRGLSVLIVEEGAWFTRRNFGGSAVDATARLYRNAGLTFTLGNPPIFLPVGRTVGGSTTINSGTCYRTPERVLESWVARGLHDLAPEKLAPIFDEVESVLGVAPLRPALAGETGRVIALGCERLGYRHGPLRRNAPDCDAQGLCALGCPTDAKRSTNISFVPLALRRGASIAPVTRLVELVMDGPRCAAAVVEHLPSGGRMTLRARSVVLAAGTLRTPLILRAAGVRARALGRNLSIHPAAAAYAGFDQPVDPTRAIPQAWSIEAFHDAGMLFEGGTVPPELAAGGLPLRGPALQEMMAKFNHTANFGFMIEDKGNGRVMGEYRDLPIVRYSLPDSDVRRIHRGLEILIGVFLAGGARWVRPLLTHDLVIRSQAELREFSGRPLRASELQLTAYHPLSTARMSVDPKEGVVDPQGRVHGLDNLYVADGSILPTSPAVNPQVTIMTLATLVANRLADRLESAASGDR